MTARQLINTRVDSKTLARAAVLARLAPGVNCAGVLCDALDPRLRT